MHLEPWPEPAFPQRSSLLSHVHWLLTQVCAEKPEGVGHWLFMPDGQLQVPDRCVPEPTGMQVLPDRHANPHCPQFVAPVRSVQLVPQQIEAEVGPHTLWKHWESAQSTARSPSLSIPSEQFSTPIMQLLAVAQLGSRQSTRPSQSLSSPSLQVSSVT